MTTATVRKLAEELASYQELKAKLEAIDGIDTTALLDTLEGETNLHEALCVVADAVLEYEDMAEAVALRIKALQARKSRLENSAENLRGIMLMAMERAGLDTVRSPVHTITARKTKPQLVVEDEAFVPSDYFDPGDPKLNKKRLKDAIEAGNQVPGARMSNGGISLTIRVK